MTPMMARLVYDVKDDSRTSPTCVEQAVARHVVTSENVAAQTADSRRACCQGSARRDTYQRIRPDDVVLCENPAERVSPGNWPIDAVGGRVRLRKTQPSRTAQDAQSRTR